MWCWDKANKGYWNDEPSMCERVASAKQDEAWGTCPQDKHQPSLWRTSLLGWLTAATVSVDPGPSWCQGGSLISQENTCNLTREGRHHQAQVMRAAVKSGAPSAQRTAPQDTLLLPPSQVRYTPLRKTWHRHLVTACFRKRHKHRPWHLLPRASNTPFLSSWGDALWGFRWS